MKGELVQGTVQRFEGTTAIIRLATEEAQLPQDQQIPGEQLAIGQLIKATVLEVSPSRPSVPRLLSRTHPDLICRLFEHEVPEMNSRIVEIKAVARAAGYRTKVAVFSCDPQVDSVGVCVGVRGCRIRNIVEELGRERLDLVPWHDSLPTLIARALQPARIQEVQFFPHTHRATVLVDADQLSLAIGRRAHNIRLASQLAGWQLELAIRTP